MDSETNAGPLLGAPHQAPQPRDGIPSPAADRLRVRLPERTRQARRWLVWRYESPARDGAKPRKVPCYPDGSPRSGKLDGEADRANLGTFEEALAAS